MILNALTVTLASLKMRVDILIVPRLAPIGPIYAKPGCRPMQQNNSKDNNNNNNNSNNSPNNSNLTGPSPGKSRLSRGRSFRGGKSAAARRLMDTAHQAAEDLTGENDGFFLDD